MPLSEPGALASWSLSESAVPPLLSIQVATDSLAALPTATTIRRSPPATLSRIRCRCLTIGERTSWAIGRNESVYCPKIG